MSYVSNKPKQKVILGMFKGNYYTKLDVVKSQSEFSEIVKELNNVLVKKGLLVKLVLEESILCVDMSNSMSDGIWLKRCGYEAVELDKEKEYEVEQIKHSEYMNRMSDYNDVITDVNKILGKNGLNPKAPKPLNKKDLLASLLDDEELLEQLIALRSEFKK